MNHLHTQSKNTHLPRIAIVVPGLEFGGGVPAVAEFLYKVIQNSGRYEPSLISLATWSQDECSVRLLSPLSWKRGAQVVERFWQDKNYYHVGAILAEFEFQRYRPRQILTTLLSQYDLIQVVVGTPSASTVTKKLQKPVCVFVASTIYQDRRNQLTKMQGIKQKWLRLMTWINAQMERTALDKVSYIFAESIYTHNLLSEMVPQDKISIGPPGVNLESFYPADTYKSDSYILSVGRFGDSRKNVDLLLHAYANLKQSDQESPKLVLAGLDGLPNDKHDLAVELEIIDSIDVYQNISLEQLGCLYRNASLFVLSSDEEGLGIVILEAMASGIPVISTRCGGPEMAVIEGETGYLIPIGDVEKLAQTMNSLLMNPELRIRMGRAGRQRIEEYFSLEAAGKIYLEKYDELLGMTNL